MHGKRGKDHGAFGRPTTVVVVAMKNGIAEGMASFLESFYAFISNFILL